MFAKGFKNQQKQERNIKELFTETFGKEMKVYLKQDFKRDKKDFKVWKPQRREIQTMGRAG